MYTVAIVTISRRLISARNAGILLCGTMVGMAAVRASAQVPDSIPATVSVSDQPLQPGDLIRLQFWRAPELSGDFRVDVTGRVLLPLLGTRMVSGVTATELRRRLTEDYGEQLANQGVDITLMRRVRILGAVRTPGLYHVDRTMNLGDALALAGGATDRGKLSGIRIFRDGEEVLKGLDINAQIAEQIRSGDQIDVPERSWIALHSGTLAAALIGSAATVISYVIFAR
jgi:protein involved in polysaccharide export with SLBB domain